jgi:hypothetical protein
VFTQYSALLRRRPHFAWATVWFTWLSGISTWFYAHLDLLTRVGAFLSVCLGLLIGGYTLWIQRETRRRMLADPRRIAPQDTDL